MYVLLFMLWLILNGKITLEIVLVGLVLTAMIGGAVYLLFDYTPKREKRFLSKLPLFIGYIFVLIWEIIKANVAMMKFILSERQAIEPVLVTFRTGLRSEFGRYMLANSITLTPGTITVDMHEDILVVHCIKENMLDISENSVFLKWIRRLEA